MKLEVIVQNGSEAKQAEQLGADRLELVAAISEGGLTPSYGTIKAVLSEVEIPVQVMIRPHSYHYHYSLEEWKAMEQDIQAVTELGGKGIVIGALTNDNEPDEEFLDRLFDTFPQLDVTFHRAFDEITNVFDAYHTLAKYPVQRILTSGGAENCTNGKNTLKELVFLSQKIKGPTILPGAGLSLENIQPIHDIVQAEEYHFGKAVRKQASFAQGFDKRVMDHLLMWKTKDVLD